MCLIYTIICSFTNRGQLYSVSESGNTAYYSYDDAGRETGVTNENGTTVTNAFDDAGRLTSVTNKTIGGTTISSFSYAYTTDNQKSSMTEAEDSDAPPHAFGFSPLLCVSQFPSLEGWQTQPDGVVSLQNSTPKKGFPKTFHQPCRLSQPQTSS